MSELAYLGRVKKVAFNPDKKYRYATVEPLVRSSEDRTRWIGTIENPKAEFPGRGIVYWHDAPIELKNGDVVQFDLKDHPFYNGEPEKEAFEVSAYRFPKEIIDVRSFGTERQIRNLVTTIGLPLRNRPLVRQCILQIEDQKWVWPFELAEGEESGSWVAADNQDLNFIRCWQIPQETIQQVELDGMRYLLQPNQDSSVGKSVGYVNWEKDEVVARRVYGRLRKFDKHAADALKISKDVYKSYVEAIEQAGLIGANSEQELAFFERVKDLGEVILKNEELLNEATRVLFEIGPLKEKVQEEAKEEYSKILAEYQNRLDEELGTKLAKMTEVVKSLSQKEEELASATEKLQDIDKKVQERASAFETALEERLRVLIEKPERLFADMAIAKAFTSKSNSHSNQAQPAPRKRTVEIDSQVSIIEEATEFRGAISKRLMALQISPLVGISLHTALLAGTIPVLVGQDAYDVVSSYADCLSGGTLHWIPVGGSLFEPSDLLARFDPVSRSLVPHSGGLLDLLLDESDAMHVVFLDGFNRASVDGYLIPLLRSAQDVAQKRRARLIPLAPPGWLSERDPYEHVSSIAWRSNVLLVLSPSMGASSLPIPTDFWAHCSIIDAGISAIGGGNGDLESTSQKSRVPCTVWDSWSDSARGGAGSREVLTSPPTVGNELPKLVLHNTERIYRAGLELGLKHERALEGAVKTTLYPYLVATGESTEMWSQHLKVVFDETDRSIVDVIKQMGE